MRVLVLEDEFLIAMMTESLLIELGVEVVGPVGDAATAMALIEDDGLDGALLDINLEDGDSFDVARRLCQDEVPFAFVTGNKAKVLPEDLRDTKRVVKPIGRRDLEPVMAGFAA